MDITQQLSKTNSVVNELLHKNSNLQRPSSTQTLAFNSLQSNITKNKEIIDIFNDSDDDLSMEEERVIEECLNDTEASLSAVDLKVFNVMNEPVATKNKKSMKKRMSERRNFLFLKDNKNETSEDEANAENVIDKLYMALADHTPERKLSFSRSPIRRMKRIRRRSTMENTRNTHIYSFFNAMADLVSTFSHSQVSKVKKSVFSILGKMIKKLENTEEYRKVPLGSRPDVLLMKYKLDNLTDG